MMLNRDVGEAGILDAHHDHAHPAALNATDYDTFVQYGAMRTASTFQFMLICLLAHVNFGLGSDGGYKRKVRCLFRPDVTSKMLADLRGNPNDRDTVFVVKTHKINGVDKGSTFTPPSDPVPPSGPVPPSLLFMSTKEDDAGFRHEVAAFEPRPLNMMLAGAQRYQEFVERGPSDAHRYLRIFPDVTHQQLRLIREYIRHWEVLRRCCGAQSSKEAQSALHGLKPKRSSAAYDNPHCSLYNLDEVEEALFNTSLWSWHWKVAHADFVTDKDMDIKRGTCCYTRVATRNGAGFHGRWRPPPGVSAYLESHGDPRQTHMDDYATCKHRNYYTDNADPLVCSDARGRRAGCAKRPKSA